MGIKDLFITPVCIVLILAFAYVIRPYVTNRSTRQYFMLALLLRFTGAILLGLVYQFYYGGGDTFNYTLHGSHWIWRAFVDNPTVAMKLILTTGGEHLPDAFQYSSRIWYYRDPNSYFVVRIAGFFDIFTFGTYSATALLFAVFSFSGVWALFSAVSRKYPDRVEMAALAVLFVPSSIFWGSGILKDTVTLGAVAWLTSCLINIIEFRDRRIWTIVVAILSLYLVFNIKVYILICFVPTCFFWIYLRNLRMIRSGIAKRVLAPFLLLLFGAFSYLVLDQVTSENNRYSLDNLAQQAAITAYDIRYGWGARTGGDGGYDIGLPDGTWQSMIRLMPSAVNVTLFRPYLWEVRNPLMLLTAIEALVVLILTVRLLLGSRWRQMVKDPFLMFCLTFSILFAFAVGVSTFNFGTLMRYKIPLIPFYGMALLLSDSNAKKDQKNPE